MESSVTSPLRSDVDRPRARLMANPRAWLVVLVVALGCYRLTLVDRGHMYWGDERCYLPAFDVVDAAGRGEIGKAVAALFSGPGGVPSARPGFVLVSTIPVAAQRVYTWATGASLDDPTSYDIASTFNVLVTLGVTVCVFGLGCVWTGCPWYGLLIAFVYSLLCNANVWVRHMVPYAESMLLYLAALWLISRPMIPDSNVQPDSACERVVARRFMMAGVLAGFAHACYPGHYALVLILIAVAMSASTGRIVNTMRSGVGFASVILGFELLSWTAGRSYLADSRRLSGTIHLGDPREGFVFIWRYMQQVEGAAGLLLLALFACFVALRFSRRRALLSSATRAAMGAALACYLLHATMGVLFGKMVFYGRVMMAFLPFLVGGAVVMVASLSRPSLRRAVVCCLLLASIGSFANFAMTYSRVEYPADFLRKTMAELGRDVVYPANTLWGPIAAGASDAVEWIDPEVVQVVDPTTQGATAYIHLASHAQATMAGAPMIGVNLKYMLYIREQYDRFSIPDDYALVAEATHPELFYATRFEGRKPWERNRIVERGYTMRIYQRNVQHDHVASMREH